MDFKIVIKSALLIILLSVILPLFQFPEWEMALLCVFLLLFNVAYIIISNLVMLAEYAVLNDDKRIKWTRWTTLILLCIYCVVFYQIFDGLFWLSLSVLFPELIYFERNIER